MAIQLAGLPMVIRTFDLGGDKLPPFLALDELRNRSSLHLRGLRFSLSERHLLDAQLRAIVQVAQTADVRILFPMVIGSHDFDCMYIFLLFKQFPEVLIGSTFEATCSFCFCIIFLNKFLTDIPSSGNSIRSGLGAVLERPCGRSGREHPWRFATS